MVEMDKSRFTKMQSDERRREYKARCKRFDDEVWPAIFQAAKDRMPDSREKQIAYDVARGAYKSPTYLQAALRSAKKELAALVEEEE